MENIRVEKDVVYDDRHERCCLDLYLPSVPATSILIWFHGGGLFEGDKSAGEAFGRVFAAQGIACAMANYRLSGPAKYPDYVHDAARTVGWMYRHAEDYGLNRDRFFIGGISAGAYLSAMLILDERYLRAEGLAPSNFCGGIILSAQVATHFKIREERGLPALGVVCDEAAPMYYVRKNIIPLLLMVADNDIPGRPEENQLFAAVLKTAGNDNVSLHVIPGRNHQTIDTQIHELGDPVGLLMLKFLGQRS
jgi:acetyl esterase/lipase